MSTRLENFCSICFNVYNDSDHQAVDLPCSHDFCVTCLIQLRSCDLHKCLVCQQDWKHHQLNAQAEHSAGSSTDAAQARAAALLEEGEDWTVNDSSWQAAVLALAQRQPRRLILREEREQRETLKADTVATIAAAARDCVVWMYLLDTFYSPDDQNTDMQRLEHVLANTSLYLSRFYGHLDAAGIARLPCSVEFLGLAIGSAGDAAAVSDMDVWKELQRLDVAVSTSVAPQHLRPLPSVFCLCVRLYGISDSQVDLIRPAVDALVPNKGLFHLCLPKCQLSAGGARRLGHQLRGVAMGTTVTLDLSGSWRPGKEERQSVAEAFSSSGECGVLWDMKWFFGEK